MSATSSLRGGRGKHFESASSGPTLVRRGNSTGGPRVENGMPFQTIVGRKHDGCIGTRGCVHETTTDIGSSEGLK